MDKTKFEWLPICSPPFRFLKKKKNPLDAYDKRKTNIEFLFRIQKKYEIIKKKRIRKHLYSLLSAKNERTYNFYGYNNKIYFL